MGRKKKLVNPIATLEGSIKNYRIGANSAIVSVTQEILNDKTAMTQGIEKYLRTDYRTLDIDENVIRENELLLERLQYTCIRALDLSTKTQLKALKGFKEKINNLVNFSKVVNEGIPRYIEALDELTNKIQDTSREYLGKVDSKTHYVDRKKILGEYYSEVFGYLTCVNKYIGVELVKLESIIETKSIDLDAELADEKDKKQKKGIFKKATDGEKTTEMINKIIKEAEEDESMGFGDKFKALKGKLKDGVDKLSENEKIASLAEKTKEATAKATEKAKEGLEKAKENEKFADIANKAKEGVNKATEKAKEGVEKAKEKVDEKKAEKAEKAEESTETKAEEVAETKAEEVAETKAEEVAETKAEEKVEAKAEEVAETKAEEVAETKAEEVAETKDEEAKKD